MMIHWWPSCFVSKVSALDDDHEVVFHPVVRPLCCADVVSIAIGFGVDDVDVVFVAEN
jgi:hypothetical protein